MVMGKLFRVYHKIERGSAYSVLLENKTDKSESILFESGTVCVLNSNETESLKPHCSFLLDVYGCLGVLNITFGDGNNFLYLVCVTSCVSVGKIHNSEIFCINDTTFLSLTGYQVELDRIQDVKKNLNSGTFYFCWTKDNQPKFDLTLCAQKYERTNITDNRFFWNRMLYLHLKSYDVNTEKWLLKVMCGGVSINTVYVGHHQAKACLISRLSCERAGTRFNVRGTNDNGHVANFVETEQVIFLEDKVASFILIRGSIPLFWEQTGVQVGTHKLKMSRGCEISQPAFDRHFAMIQYLYGKQVIINLVGNKDGEYLIGTMYKAHHKNSPFKNEIPYIAFDYHYLCPRGREDNLALLKKKIVPYYNEFSFYYSSKGQTANYQKGTFRVNCIDCLDRTNRVQTFIGLQFLLDQLKSLKLDENPTTVSKFHEVYKNMWHNNGDQVSRIYAGTGALEGKSKLRDGTLSVARTIQNNLLDNSKQEAIDILLTGKPLLNEYSDKTRSLLPTQYLHLPSHILLPLSQQYFEYTDLSTIKVAVGTWNVNGGKHFNSIIYKKSDPLSDWLLDANKSQSNKNQSSLLDLSLDAQLSDLNEDSPDFYAIGFEEIVDLSAQNIVATSTTNQKEWLTELQNTISRYEKYVLITSVQLVGVCLFVFAKPKFGRFIREVSTDQVKTGLGGAAGNKGGVGIRFLLHNTSMCFVCAHFAAGQHQFNERNSDFREITKKMFSSIGKHLNSHDYVFWCGDFNYRIDLPIDEVKSLVNQSDWGKLLEFDQLKVQMNQKKVFQNYKEGEVQFPPTYKYDVNSDDYDTSEKSRIPAWTDRILFKKNYPTRVEENNGNFDYGEILFYGRAELKTSDHRPVIAEIKIDVLKVDNVKRIMVFRDIVERLGPVDSTVIIKEVKQDSEKVSVFEEKEVVDEILSVLQKEIGEVILARIVDDHLRVTFKDGKLALKLSEMETIEIVDKLYSVSLKTPNWIDLIEEEVNYGVNNTIPLLDECVKINIDDLNEYDISKVSRPDTPPETEVILNSVQAIPTRPPPPNSTDQAKIITENFQESISNKPVRRAPPRPKPVNCTVKSNFNDGDFYGKQTLDDSFDLPPPMDAPPELLDECEFSTSFDDSYADDDDQPPPNIPPPNIPPPNIPPPNVPPPNVPAPNVPPPIPTRRPPPMIPPRNN